MCPCKVVSGCVRLRVNRTSKNWDILLPCSSYGARRPLRHLWLQCLHNTQLKYGWYSHRIAPILYTSTFASHQLLGNAKGSGQDLLGISSTVLLWEGSPRDLGLLHITVKSQDYNSIEPCSDRSNPHFPEYSGGRHSIKPIPIRKH